jgi:Uncharacterized conserved protein
MPCFLNTSTTYNKSKPYKLSIINNFKFPFLQYIYTGDKKAECRISTEYIKKFKIGDKLILQGKNEFALCKITFLNFYKNFEIMVSSEGFHNLIPFAKNEEDAIRIYKNFPGATRVKSKGCCAIGVKWLEGKLMDIHSV